MKYSKYHGLGNDYIAIDRAELPPDLTPEQVVRICDRNFGVGSDGIVLVEKETAEGFIVRILNPDGSEAENSGNGMRIVSRYLFDTGRVAYEPFTLLVKGERKLRGLIIDPQNVIQVDMGRATFTSSEIPVVGEVREVLREPLEVLGEKIQVSCVNVGNPHCVVFDYPNLKAGAKRLGPILEKHAWFPRKINVQFAQVIDRSNIRIEIWERGAGYTFASGSSASAASSAAHRLGLVDSKVTVHMPGGSLAVEIGEGYSIRLTGPVTKVADGEISSEIFRSDAAAERLAVDTAPLSVKDLIPGDLGVDSALLEQAQGIPVRSITDDSRKVQPGSVFFAVSGSKVDARSFIDDAFARGAVAVVHGGGIDTGQRGFEIVVPDVRRALAYAAHVFYGKPSLATKNVAVTGTSGKTSVAWILSHALTELDTPTFLGGTLGYTLLERGDSPAAGLTELGNTTLDPISVQRRMVKAVRAGAQASVFEATSQGVVHRRLRDVAWDIAVFTNLTRDHLDLHGNMEAYEAAKRELFTTDLVLSPKPNRAAIFNFDDEAGRRIGTELRRSHPEIRVISLSKEHGEGIDYVIAGLSATAKGLSYMLKGRGEEIAVQSRFVGDHNAYNLACSVLALRALGHSAKAIEDVIARVPAVPGRLEPVEGSGVPVYVDYAHKPDALEKVLRFLKPLCKGRLISVFGCGGDRDTGKRPVMGELSYRLADLTIITSDNPRTEDPDTIVKQILSGISDPRPDSLIVEVDRRKAIHTAIAMAKEGDIVLIAGKGHEPYQEIHGVKHPFSDIQVARELN